MSRVNTTARKPAIHTHEGAKAVHITPEMQLGRSVMACLLWEDTFYEDGVSIAERIKSLAATVDPTKVANIAIMAREEMHLRHVPLLLVRELARRKFEGTANVLERVIQRADELTEFVSIYFMEGRKPLSGQVKRGLAKAFRKFNEYQLAKYNRPDKVKLRDVLRLCHPKPVDEAQSALWKRLKEGTLAVPDTWETALSATKGEGKTEAWTRLLKEEKLGGMALLRNLRNMKEANVPRNLVQSALTTMKTDRILPFRFIAAARHAPEFEPQIEAAMLRSMKDAAKLPGHTVLLIDVSGSMHGAKVSAKSEIDRVDAACGLAIIGRELCEDCTVITFADDAKLVPARRGFALRDAIQKNLGGSTNTRAGIEKANEQGYDRIIVITDEQSHTTIGPPQGKGYFINVAVYKNGIGYGPWTHIDGWSDAVFRYVMAAEKE